MDLALNDLQRLICHKTHQTKPDNKSLFLFNAPLSHPRAKLINIDLMIFTQGGQHETYLSIF